MTDTFVRAEQLKAQFDVLGHFYGLPVGGGASVPCRSVLQIRAKGSSDSEPADAVAVMMNPGSSKPLTETGVRSAMDPRDPFDDRWEPTQPDVTQYQLMRVMCAQGWRHVRVINLSDLLEPKSGWFVTSFRALEAAGNQRHSVFAPERASELAARLRRAPGAPVICAWGVSAKLGPLTARAMQRLACEQPIGIAKHGRPDAFFHPLPRSQQMMERWVSDLLALEPLAAARSRRAPSG